MLDVDLNEAKNLLHREAAAIDAMANALDERFAQAVKMILDCPGCVVITGMGKAGLIGQKISATMASTGTLSHFLHPSEAIHGDLGRVRQNDLVLLLSNSGESEEIVRLIGLLKQLGNTIIGITSKQDSVLAKYSDLTLPLGDIEEVCPLGVAPSTSTTCMLALGDALALTVMKMRHFTEEDYSRYHPGGALGRKLVTVEQAALFSRGKRLPWASDTLTVEQAINEAETHAELRHGCILLVNEEGRLSGLLTDGDLRRILKKFGSQALHQPVKDVMTPKPRVVKPQTLASEAMAIFHKGRIDEIPVVDDEQRPVGLIDVQDVVTLKTMQ